MDISRPVKKSPRGFTLVELLVVIGIIAVLIAILLPSLSKAQEQARRTQCLSNLRQLAIYAVQYANDCNNVFPTGPVVCNGYSVTAVTTKTGIAPGNYMIHLGAVPYIFYNYCGFGNPQTAAQGNTGTVAPAAQVFECPSNPIFVTANDDYGSFGAYQFNDPYNSTAIPYPGQCFIETSYLYLGALPPSYPTSYLSYELKKSRRPARLGETGGATKAIFADRVEYDSSCYLWSIFNESPVFYGWVINHGFIKKPGGNITPNGSNEVFTDGHGEWVTAFPSALVPSSPYYNGQANSCLVYLQDPVSYGYSWWW